MLVYQRKSKSAKLCPLGSGILYIINYPMKTICHFVWLTGNSIDWDIAPVTDKNLNKHHFHLPEMIDVLKSNKHLLQKNASLSCNYLLSQKNQQPKQNIVIPAIFLWHSICQNQPKHQNSVHPPILFGWPTKKQQPINQLWVHLTLASHHPKPIPVVVILSDLWPHKWIHRCQVDVMWWWRLLRSGVGCCLLFVGLLLDLEVGDTLASYDFVDKPRYWTHAWCNQILMFLAFRTARWLVCKPKSKSDLFNTW